MDSIIISETDFQRARKKIRDARALGKSVIFTSKDYELNRQVLEKENIDIFMPVLFPRKDRQRQRDSGFNQVLAKEAKKKSVALGINLDEIRDRDKKEKSEIIGRIRQNIKLARKEKLSVIFISKEEKDERNLASLGLVLGMPTWMTKHL